MNKSNGTLLQAVLFILFIALAIVDGWASCVQRSYCLQSCSNTYCLNQGHGEQYCAGAISTVASQYGDLLASTNCPVCDMGTWGYAANLVYTTCSNVCEADSIKCLNAGGTWTNTGASTCDGKSCKLPVCKQADTQWLDSAKSACDALGGENNFAITEVGETCVHSGTCCTASDSIPVGNTCKWRCDSALTQCNGRVGSLFGAVLPDTSVSGEDTTFSYQCFYNCAYSPNPDSTVYLVEGNTVLSGPSDSIADGIKSEWFSSIRSTTGSIYVYDYLSPSASEYVDSIAAMKCVEHLWRCVINNKYVYWYDNQEVPAGCTNIVRVK